MVRKTYSACFNVPKDTVQKRKTLVAQDHFKILQVSLTGSKKQRNTARFRTCAEGCSVADEICLVYIIIIIIINYCRWIKTARAHAD